jgi:hypothetical protein
MEQMVLPVPWEIPVLMVYRALPGRQVRQATWVIPVLPAPVEAQQAHQETMARQARRGMMDRLVLQERQGQVV